MYPGQSADLNFALPASPVMSRIVPGNLIVWRRSPGTRGLVGNRSQFVTICIANA